MLGISDVIEKVLSEDNGEGSKSEQIARAIADRAAGGDVTAAKFLRELSDSEASDKTCEIRVSVIE